MPGQMLGSWAAKGEAKDVVTLRSALTKQVEAAQGHVIYAKGTDILTTSDKGFVGAVAAAKKSDIVVLALGEDAVWMTGEAGSRAHLDLPGNQEQLLEAVAATGKPVVLLVFSGRPLVLNWAAAARARNHGSVVSGDAGRAGAGERVARRECSQRSAHHQFPARRRPGAAVLQPFQYRASRGRRRPVASAHKTTRRNMCRAISTSPTRRCIRLAMG